MSASLIADNLLRPFQLERSALRGRVVRLGALVDRVLTRHDYPESVGRLLGELFVLAATLAGGLKFDGTFSLQIQSDGPVSLMLADCTNDGAMRGYARYDEARLAAASGTDVQALLGARPPRVHRRPEPARPSLSGHRRAERRDAHRLHADLFPAERAAQDRAQDRGRPDRRRRRRALARRRHRDPAARRRGARRVEPRAGGRGLAAHDAPARHRHRRPSSSTRTCRRSGCCSICSTRKACACSRRTGCASAAAAAGSASRRMLRRFPEHELDDMRDDDGDVVVTCQFCNIDFRFDDAQLARLHGKVH